MKNRILKLFSIVFLLLMVTNIHALEIVQSGNTITQKGEYSSTRFAAGNKVTNLATVDGLSFVAGNDITLNGKASYGFYAGNIVTINENIEKDAFIAGNNITIGKEAVLGRDVFIAGNTVVISSNVGRDLRVGASIIDLSDITINGDAYVMADQIVLNENTNIVGKLSYSEDATVEGLTTAKIGSIEKVKDIEIEYSYTFKDRALTFLTSVVAAFVVMVVLFYLIPSSKENLDKLELQFKDIAKTSGIGLLVLVLVPLVSILAMITGFLLPLSLIALVIYAVSIYLSFLVIYYVVGNVISNKLLNKNNMYLALVIGILLVKLVSLIPYLGGWIKFISLIYGLGIIYNFIKNIRNNK